MRSIPALLLLAALAASCGTSPAPDTRRLEGIYAGLAAAEMPGTEPDVTALDSLRAEIDRLGGRARVESLMVRSMQEEPERWRVFLDSLAQSLP